MDLCENCFRQNKNFVKSLHLQRLKMSQVGEVAGVNMKKGIVGDISATVNNKIVKLGQSHTQRLSEKYKKEPTDFCCRDLNLKSGCCGHNTEY